MYNFLLSEVWWMESIISAGLAAIATIIAAVLVYNFKIKTIFKNSETMLGFKDVFSSQHGDLSGEHDELSKEHSDLLRDHEVILERNKNYYSALEKTTDATFGTITLLAKDFEAEKAKEEMRYENLSSKQLDLVNIADKIKAMGFEIKDLSFRLNEVNRENNLLMEENRELKNELSELKKERDRKRNKGLER